VKVEVAATPEAAAHAAAAEISARLRHAVAHRQHATLALSGGNTPRPMFTALACADVPWNDIDIFQVDERIAPAGDTARNASSMVELLVEPAHIPAAKVHLMPVERDDLPAAAAEYGALMERIAGLPPHIDVIHLGIGSDGHTASLLPGDAALTEMHASVAVTGSYQEHRRMTVTFAVLNRGRRIVWLINGADKAAALARLRRGDETIPAGRVSSDRAVVFADAAAAGLRGP
jgi:6-phosphogluconolactonase